MKKSSLFMPNPAREDINLQHIKETREIKNPVLRKLLARARGEQKDGKKIALAIEGGGMAGTVSAGMCMALEELGLTDYVDIFVGCSSGSLNASYTAAGQARLHSHLYPDSAREPGFIEKRRALLGKPVMNLSLLFDRHMTLFRPYSEEVLTRDLNLLVYNTDKHELEILNGFTSTEEVRIATWASCAIPLIAGDEVSFRGQNYIDGGLVESIPYQSALRLGADQVLVLRSRDATHKKTGDPFLTRILGERMIRRLPLDLQKTIQQRNECYNESVDELLSGQLAGRVEQVALREDTPLISNLENNPDVLLQGFRSGAEAILRELTDQDTILMPAFQIKRS